MRWRDYEGLSGKCKKCGVLIPDPVHLRDDGEYEITAEHRRHGDSQLVGKETMPCIVRELDDAVTIVMVTQICSGKRSCPVNGLPAF